MSPLELLKTTLLDIAFAVKDDHVPLTIGGGFGLYLKYERLRETGERTLFPSIAEPRVTNDIDLFVRADILARIDVMQNFARCLQVLGFQPAENAKYFQWTRTVHDGAIKREVKLDLLVGPIDEFQDVLKTDKLPRVRPKGELQLHAYRTPEAIDIDKRSSSIVLKGTMTNGDAYEALIYLPQSFTYVMMKLFAFDDRKTDSRRDVGRHHALDLYQIVAMMTEPEYQDAIELSKAHFADPHVARACSIVGREFGSATSLGMLRLREHPLFRDAFPLQDFMAVLAELFPPT